MKRLEMDGLRGVACLIVLIFHAAAEYWPDAIWLLRGTARIGVWLFFVLSAFLLTMKLWEDGLSVRSMVRYTVDRFLRIIPLFVLAVLVYHQLGMIGLTSWEAVGANLLLQQPANHLWTIPPEFTFYFLLPFIAFGISLVKQRAGAAWAVILLIALMAVVAIVYPPNANLGTSELWPYFTCFGFGTLSAFAVRHLPRPSPLALNLIASAAFVGLLAYIAVQKAGVFEEPTFSIAYKQVEISAFWAVFAYAVYSGRTYWSPILTFPPLAAFGLAIYSTYLFHWMFMEWFARRPEWWAVPIAVIASIAVGVASAVTVERLLRWMRRPTADFLLSLLSAARTAQRARL